MVVLHLRDSSQSIQVPVEWKMEYITLYYYIIYMPMLYLVLKLLFSRGFGGSNKRKKMQKFQMFCCLLLIGKLSLPYKKKIRKDTWYYATAREKRVKSIVYKL